MRHLGYGHAVEAKNEASLFLLGMQHWLMIRFILFSCAELDKYDSSICLCRSILYSFGGKGRKTKNRKRKKYIFRNKFETFVVDY